MDLDAARREFPAGAQVLVLRGVHEGKVGTVVGVDDVAASLTPDVLIVVDFDNEQGFVKPDDVALWSDAG